MLDIGVTLSYSIRHMLLILACFQSMLLLGIPPLSYLYEYNIIPNYATLFASILPPSTTLSSTSAPSSLPTRLLSSLVSLTHTPSSFLALYAVLRLSLFLSPYALTIIQRHSPILPGAKSVPATYIASALAPTPSPSLAASIPSSRSASTVYNVNLTKATRDSMRSRC